MVTTSGLPLVSEWLKAAEKNWKVLDDDDVLLDERENDGSWIRPWRQALRDFSRS